VGYRCSECGQTFEGEPYDYQGFDVVPPYSAAEKAAMRELADDMDSPERKAIMARHQVVSDLPRCRDCGPRCEAEELRSFDEAMTVASWDQLRHPERVRVDPATGDLLPLPMSVKDIAEDERDDFRAYSAFVKMVGPENAPG
jgi:hypothetical protein